MPWDSLGRVCNQSYTIKEKSSRGTVASYGRAGKLFVVSKKRHWPSKRAVAPLAASSSSAVLPLGFLQTQLLSFTPPLGVLSPHHRHAFSSPGSNLEDSVDDGFAQFHFWLLNTFWLRNTREGWGVAVVCSPLALSLSSFKEHLPGCIGESEPLEILHTLEGERRSHNKQKCLHPPPWTPCSIPPPLFLFLTLVLLTQNISLLIACPPSPLQLKAILFLFRVLLCPQCQEQCLADSRSSIKIYWMNELTAWVWD